MSSSGAATPFDMKYAPQPWWQIAQQTSPIWPPATSVWSLVKYSAAGKLSSFVLMPVFCSNSGSRSFSVSASLPVRTCRRTSTPADFAAGCAAEAPAAAGAVVGFASAAGAAGLTASAGFAASAGLAGSAGLVAGADVPQAARKGARAVPRAATLRLRTTVRRLNRRGSPSADAMLRPPDVAFEHRGYTRDRWRHVTSWRVVAPGLV